MFYDSCALAFKCGNYVKTTNIYLIYTRNVEDFKIKQAR